MVILLKNIETMNNDRIKELFIDGKVAIIAALQQMDSIKRKLLIVTKEGKYYSLLSIGDIQRAIIANISTATSVEHILRHEVKVASVTDDKEEIKKNIKERRNEYMPIVNTSGEVVDVVFWEDLFMKDERKTPKVLNMPVVIMAGGQGTRLRPLTNVFPKPLLPIGGQTIVEDIMDNFVEYGCHKFFLSVNYKAAFIKLYFESISGNDYQIEYLEETKPLGTAGSLRLLKERIKSTFFVSNCDILIDEDYAEILNFHISNGNEITVVAAIKSISLPYGSLKTTESGILESLSEKPEYIFKVNTGMYILEAKLLEEIPMDQFYNITDLIQDMLNKQRKVGVFPINQGSWTDIGNWDDYLNIVKPRSSSC